MAHTPAQISIYLWLNMEASEQRLFLFCTIHVQYRVPFKKKKIFFHKRWLCSKIPSLKDKNCLQKYFYESKVYS